jgi:hypothetical protein
MTDLSITRYAELQPLKIEVCLTQSRVAGGTAHPRMLSTDNTDFDSMNF